MNLTVDTDRCVGNGICEALAPELFEVTTLGQAQLLVDAIPSDRELLAHKAAESCPALALRVIP